MRRNLMCGVVISLCVCFLLAPASAELKLPAILGDNMVLQRDLPVPVWGWAEPGYRPVRRADRFSEG